MGKVYGILGDIHANIDALETVVEDARSLGVTNFVCVGDVVGYNACPAECIRIVRDELQAPCVCGNHDYYVAYGTTLEDFHPAAAQVVRWTREQISEYDRTWLRSLPMSRPVMGFTIVHSTLDMPERWGYVFDDFQADAHFVYQKTPLCFHGHTHVPVIYENTPTGAIHIEAADFVIPLGKKLYINVGSVGQPRDGDPRASYAIYDPIAREIRFRRLEYDVERAQARDRAAGLPDRCADRLALGQ